MHRSRGRHGALARRDDLRSQLGWYMRNCAFGPTARNLDSVLLDRLELIIGRGVDEGDEGGFCPELDESLSKASPNYRDARRRELRKVVTTCPKPPIDDESPERNIRFAREEFGLDDIDVEILLLVLRYERNDLLEHLADEVLQKLQAMPRALAALLGIETAEARRRLAADSALISGGLLSISDDEHSTGFAGRSGCVRLTPPLRRSMRHYLSSREEWLVAVIGETVVSPLGWDDFTHLGSMRDLATKVMAGAPGAKGLNLLLHGPVGTGKTEFAKVLAAQAGRQIWSIGETSPDGDEPSRGERLAALKLAQRLLASRSDALILFDEAEDLLEGGNWVWEIFTPSPRRQGSKVHINRILEQNQVPVIWTCNEVGGMDPAVLRRMTLAVELATPNQAVRARIWGRALTDAGVTLDPGAVRRLSSRYAAPPAVAANAARAASLVGGGEAEIEQAMIGVLGILGIGPGVAEPDPGDFDPALVSCRVDVPSFADQLARVGAGTPWSLCLNGPPGTGKSQFARHLAQRIGLEVLHKRASDLLSKWLGESEKQIAEAFQTARVQRQMLLIDEADSLLFDRREAARSWEVTQVNEMLTWMESHPLPFVFTTNLVERLDQASLRRFTFKLRFEPLGPAKAALAFERFFGCPPPWPLADGLTPADFALVRRKRDVLGGASPEMLATWLAEEAEAKGIRLGRIGFG